jgi:hypothetical protein
MAGKQYSLDSRMDLVSTMNSTTSQDKDIEDAVNEEEEKGRTSSFS